MTPKEYRFLEQRVVSLAKENRELRKEIPSKEPEPEPEPEPPNEESKPLEKRIASLAKENRALYRKNAGLKKQVERLEAAAKKLMAAAV